MHTVELPEEVKERLPVESLRLSPIEEFSVPQTHGAKIAHTAPGGIVEQNRVAVFRRYPKSAPGAVLLKMHLVEGP